MVKTTLPAICLCAFALTCPLLLALLIGTWRDCSSWTGMINTGTSVAKSRKSPVHTRISTHFWLHTFQSRLESTSQGGLNLDSFKSYATGSELKSSCERSLRIKLLSMWESILQVAWSLTHSVSSFTASWRHFVQRCHGQVLPSCPPLLPAQSSAVLVSPLACKQATLREIVLSHLQ